MQFGLDFWDITQDDKIDKMLPGPIVANQCTVQSSPVCDRGTPLPGDTLGPLLNVYSSFSNVGEQHVQGIDLSAYSSWDVGGGALSVNLDYPISSSSSVRSRRPTVDFQAQGHHRQVRVPGGSIRAVGRLGPAELGLQCGRQLHRQFRGPERVAGLRCQHA
jgi:hypothetical protein